MSVYVDDLGLPQLPRATVTVHEETRSARVSYRDKDGSKFTVMVKQKPNAIGFHARLPGDKSKR